jgi:hypothetical protein
MNIGIPQNKSIMDIARRTITIGLYDSLAISINDDIWRHIANNVNRNVGINTDYNL